MAKKDVKKAEEAVEKVEETKQPKAEEKGTFKVKPKMRKVNKDEVIKVDLRKVNKEEVPKEEAQENAEEKVEETTEAVLEEVKEEQPKLPENIQKVIDFMDETGGDLEDYVKLNQDYSKYDDAMVLREYYRQTKPHLTSSEIDFLMEDGFTYDEEVDDPKDITRKKLAFKEQVASARSHMDKLKSNYYTEIKSGVKLTPEQQKAIDFFNRYNEEKQESDKTLKTQQTTFINKTNEVFNDKFKGFEYNVGDKRYRFNVKNANEVKTSQSDINNFVKRFVDKKNMMSDAVGYHKSLFTAMNADAVANHFYEQGRADGIKQSMANAKNVDMAPRQAPTEIEAGGIKVRAISGDSTSKLRFKMRK